jgi:hypothetical protein
VALVRVKGLEPLRPYGHENLNLACLPIPPHPPKMRASSRPIFKGCGLIANNHCRDQALSARSWVYLWDIRWIYGIYSDFKTLGRASGRFSAIKPRPKDKPHASCSHTAAHAALHPLKEKPARTSPEPAVASHGGALSAIAARPSGEARPYLDLKERRPQKRVADIVTRFG